MEESIKAIKERVEGLERLMLEILELAPGEGWHHIVVAQRNVLRAQVETVMDGDKKAS